MESFSVRSHAEFEIPFKSLTGALAQSSVRRKNCYVNCELLQYASGCVRPQFQARIKSFIGFETLIIHLEGKVLKSDFPQEAVADDDPMKKDKLYKQNVLEAERRGEYKGLTDAEEMFRMLEAHLGKGKVLDVPNGSEALYERRHIFYPFQHTTRTQR